MPPEEQKDFNKRIENVENALKKAVDENNLILTTEIQFPQYRELPIKIRLALVILAEENAKIIRHYENKKSNNKKENK